MQKIVAFSVFFTTFLKLFFENKFAFFQGKTFSGKKDWLRRNNNMKLRSQRQTHICRQRLIERCSWPQCNQLCPKLHNPYTGTYSHFELIFLLKASNVFFVQKLGN